MSTFAGVDELDPAGQVSVEPSAGFVLTPAVSLIADRALAYLRAGYPVHLCGPTGTGKTTLAFHVASKLERPIVLLHGDHQLTSADLVGSPSGTRTSRVVDNYIRSVVRTEEERRELWVDNRLTTACRYGHTLIYDEFNRTTAEANNPLLSVFSEGILNLPKASDGRESYLRVHPKFAAILTSNPEEYAGVFRTPDALLDRVITIVLDYYDGETETSIVAARTGVDFDFAHQIVAMVRGLRNAGSSAHRPTIRAAITIAKVLKQSGLPISSEPVVRSIFADVLGADPFKILLSSTAPGSTGAAADSPASDEFKPADQDFDAAPSVVVAPDEPGTSAMRAEEAPDSPILEVSGATMPAELARAMPAEPLDEREQKRAARQRKRGGQPAAAWLNAFDERSPQTS